MVPSGVGEAPVASRSRQVFETGHARRRDHGHDAAADTEVRSRDTDTGSARSDAVSEAAVHDVEADAAQ